MDLEKFACKKQLLVDPNEKKLYLLGEVQGSQGQAIVILSANIPKIQPFAVFIKVFENDIYARFEAKMMGSCEIQTIFPATEKQITKYRQKVMKRRRQSGEEYAKKKNNLLAKELMHIEWVTNILNGSAQIERVLLRKTDFAVLPDLSFTNLQQKNRLHLLVICADSTLHCLRQLNAQHLPLLHNIIQCVQVVLRQKFEMQIGDVKMFFHYPPTFYRLHLHIVALAQQSRISTVQRCHQIEDVIQNISLCPTYYEQASLNVFVEQSFAH